MIRGTFISVKRVSIYAETVRSFCRAGQYKKVGNLKQKYPKLKVLIAIGGAGEKYGKYSNMAETPENRKAFIESVLVFIK